MLFRLEFIPKSDHWLKLINYVHISVVFSFTKIQIWKHGDITKSLI